MLHAYARSLDVPVARRRLRDGKGVIKDEASGKEEHRIKGSDARAGYVSYPFPAPS
jgi:hypothetical protein